MKKLYAASILFSGLALTGLNGQCLMIEAPLSQKVQASDVIIEGKVISKTSFWNKEQTNIYTSNTVGVYKVFKGNISSSTVEVITPGGVVGTKMEIVTPSLELNPGDEGIFFGIPSPVSHPSATSVNYEPYASAQGFVKYDLIDQTASDHFHIYHNIQSELYDAIQKQVGIAYEKMQSFDPAQSPLNKYVKKESVPPSISGFTPTTITAGTLSVLTINGSNFGTNTGSAKVELKNADDGGATYLTVSAQNIVSWTASQIQVKVPSKTGTGTIRVTDNAGASVTSSTSVTMTYGELTAVDGQGVENKIKAANKNTAGGYTFKYCTTFNNNAAAVASFERALSTWRCGTLVNFNRSGTVADVCNAKDGNNIVNFDGGCALGGSLLGITNTYYDACSSSSVWYWTLTEMDIRFRTTPSTGTWNYGPGATSGGKYDFETIALHEIAHAHLIAHVIDPPALMHWSRNQNTDIRTLSSGSDIAAGNDVLSRSLTNNPCGATAHVKISPNTCTLAGVKEADLGKEGIRIYPNPFSSETTLRISSDILNSPGTIVFSLYDILGNKVREDASITVLEYTISQGNLPGGVYFYQVKNGNEILGAGRILLSPEK